MIPALEIKERTREFSLPTSTIEWDYTQNWLLAAQSLISSNEKVTYVLSFSNYPLEEFAKL